MAKFRMDYYINVKPREDSTYYNKKEKIITIGFRNGTFYYNGDPTKVISHDDISSVFVIKDGTYQPISCESFIALFRKWK